MDQTHFHTCLDELFELDEGSVQSDSVLQEIEGWSSLTFMGLIALVDEEYEVTLSPGTVLASKTIGELWAAIEQAQTSEAAA